MSKRKLLPAAAIAVIAALALPAAAGAEWLHHETPINEDAEVGLTGNSRFQGSLGGIECQVTSTVSLAAGQTDGSMETFTPHPTSETSNCKGLGGLAFCQAHNLTPQVPKWPLHKTFVLLKIFSVTLGNPIVIQLIGAFCPAKKISVTPGLLYADPNQDSTVSSVQLSGELQADVETSGGTTDTLAVQASGTLNVESPNAATYSL